MCHISGGLEYGKLVKCEVKVTEEEAHVRENGNRVGDRHMVRVGGWSCNLRRYPATRRLEEQVDWPKEARGIKTWKGSEGQGGHQSHWVKEGEGK